MSPHDAAPECSNAKLPRPYPSCKRSWYLLGEPQPMAEATAKRPWQLRVDSGSVSASRGFMQRAQETCLGGAYLWRASGLVCLPLWPGLDGRVLQGWKTSDHSQTARSMFCSTQALGGKGAGKLFTITENPISGLPASLLVGTTRIRLLPHA